MQKHAFHAMGTTFELVVEAETAGERSRGRGGGRTARTDHVALSSRLGAVRSSIATVRSTRHRTSPRSSSSHSQPVNRPCGRFDPTIHDALVGAGLRPDLRRDSGRHRLRLRTAACVRRRRDPHRPADRARAGRQARPRRHRQGLRGRACRGTARNDGTLPRQRRWGRRRTRRPHRRDVGGRRRRHTDARADARRSRNLRPRPPPLAAWRDRAAPPDRACNRPPVGDRPRARDGDRRRRGRCRGARKGALSRRLRGSTRA